MTTITITLEDELAARLFQCAAELGITPEELAKRAIVEMLEQVEGKNREAEIEQITSRVFARRKSAYEKLAEGAP